MRSKVRLRKVRLMRKFAEVINGIDLSSARPGDEIELPSRAAEMLIAEAWAAPADTHTNRPDEPKPTTTGRSGRKT
jgi:hypothetical protein